MQTLEYEEKGSREGRGKRKWKEGGRNEWGEGWRRMK